MHQQLKVSQLETLTEALKVKIENEITIYNSKFPNFDEKQFKATDPEYLSHKNFLEEVKKQKEAIKESAEKLLSGKPENLTTYLDYCGRSVPMAIYVYFQDDVEEKISSNMNRLVANARTKFFQGQNKLTSIGSWSYCEIIKAWLLTNIDANNIPTLDELFGMVYEYLIETNVIYLNNSELEPAYNIEAELITVDKNGESDSDSMLVYDEEEDEDIDFYEEDWDEED